MAHLTKKKIAVHEGVIRPNLVRELESFHAPDPQRVTSCYLNLDPRRWGSPDAFRIALKTSVATYRQEIEQQETRHEVRQSLLHDLEVVEELAPTVYGERSTRGLACFLGSELEQGYVLPLPWPVRERAFFEDRFVLWPLKLLLDQSERYAIILTDKDDARLFLYFLERIEEMTDIRDEVPGRIRFPAWDKDNQYMNKHTEYYHQHFDNVSEAALRWFEREPFQHLIIGGLWEILPQFESRLHRYLRDRIVARWDIDVMHTPTPAVRERAEQEERQVLKRQAEAIWQAIQDNRLQRGAVGPEEVFAALWRRAVESLVEEPGVARPGYRCTNCTRLSLSGGPCVACGSDQKTEVATVYEEALLDAIDQAAHVREWSDPALHAVDSIAALRRF